MSTDTRRQELQHWLEQIGYPTPQLETASADASARRYFRFAADGNSLIAVDAPLPRAENEAFITLAAALRQAGLHAPQIHHCDLDHGRLVIEDFGRCTFAQALARTPTDDHPGLYRLAIATLDTLQTSEHLQRTADTLPRYHRAMVTQELALFPQWCLQAHLDCRLSDEDRRCLAALDEQLTAAFAEQPQGFVHRDLHSRNLMLLERGGLGVIDFQGAVHGPLCYDGVSLLRDCYVTLPPEHFAPLQQSLLASLAERCGADTQQLARWFDLCGLQRHLKAIGIFCRLAIRDAKPGYLGDLPRTQAYVTGVCEQHPELAPLRELLARHRVAERLR